MTHLSPPLQHMVDCMCQPDVTLSAFANRIESLETALTHLRTLALTYIPFAETYAAVIEATALLSLRISDEESNQRNWLSETVDYKTRTKNTCPHGVTESNLCPICDEAIMSPR